MSRRILTILAAILLPMLAACGGRAGPGLTAEAAFARLPEEIAGFQRSRPDGAEGAVIARYAHPNRASASVLAVPLAAPGDRRPADAEREADAAVEAFARATVTDAAARRENATLRHFGARAGEAGPTARCLDVQLRGALPRRQIGCASLLERRVFLVTMVAPEEADARRGPRDPLLAVTLRLIGALSGAPPEVEAQPAGTPTADADLPPPPGAAPPAPPRAAPPRPRPKPPVQGPLWRT